MVRCSYYLLLACSLACVVLLGEWEFRAWLDAASAPALMVEQPVKVFSDLVCGEAHDVEYRVVNHSAETHRVVGIEFS